MSGRESASRTLPRMRIGCGRLVAVLWTLLMKDTSRPGKHHEDRLFLQQTSSTPLQKRYGRGRRSGAFVRGGRRLWREDVYLVRAKRIRFHRKTYTFCSRYVYVLMRRGIRSARATDEAGTLSEGEGRAKVQAFGEGRGGLLAGRGIQQAPSRRHEDGCWGLCFSGSAPRARAAGRYIRERRSLALWRSSLPSMEAPKE